MEFFMASSSGELSVNDAMLAAVGQLRNTKLVLSVVLLVIKRLKTVFLALAERM